jgi:micrococcal nuclease
VIEDASQDRRDRYGRRLAYVELANGRDLGESQVAAGHAKVYVFERPFARVSRYRRAQRAARARGSGAWTSCEGDFHRPE